MYSQTHNGLVLKSVFYWVYMLSLHWERDQLVYTISLATFCYSHSASTWSLNHYQLDLFLLRVSWAKEHFPNPTQPQIPEGTPEALQDCEHFSSHLKELQEIFVYYLGDCLKGHISLGFFSVYTSKWRCIKAHMNGTHTQYWMCVCPGEFHVCYFPGLWLQARGGALFSGSQKGSPSPSTGPSALLSAHNHASQCRDRQ